jgi:uncharacterized protein with HEPN domain
MSPARESRQYILDMLDATTKARAFVKGIDEQAFLNNEEKIFAVIHALERIGEAAKHVPAGVKKRYPQVPWRLIAGTRDKLIHAYFDVHVERLWFTVRDDLPGLEQALRTILIEMD